MTCFEEVKNLISLEQVAKHYGIVFDGNNKALCPFHDDKRPSFSLHPDKQFAKCFSCGATADAINMEYRLAKHIIRTGSDQELLNKISKKKEQS